MIQREEVRKKIMNTEHKSLLFDTHAYAANRQPQRGNILQRQATRFEVSTLSSSWASNGMMLGSSSKTKTKVCQGQRILKAQSS